MDSSDFATGSVLSQESKEDCKWHLVVFFSKFLSLVEWNYEIHNKEMLAIIQVLKEWQHFLKGVPNSVEIYTDHQNLEYFMTTKKLNCRQAHWSLYLARFDFVLHYHPGKSIGKPNAHSQQSDYRDGSCDNENVVLLRPKLLAVCALKRMDFESKEKSLLANIQQGSDITRN